MKNPPVFTNVYSDRTPQRILSAWKPDGTGFATYDGFGGSADDKPLISVTARGGMHTAKNGEILQEWEWPRNEHRNAMKKKKRRPSDASQASKAPRVRKDRWGFEIDDAAGPGGGKALRGPVTCVINRALIVTVTGRADIEILFRPANKSFQVGVPRARADNYLDKVVGRKPDGSLVLDLGPEHPTLGERHARDKAKGAANLDEVHAFCWQLPRVSASGRECEAVEIRQPELEGTIKWANQFVEACEGGEQFSSSITARIAASTTMFRGTAGPGTGGATTRRRSSDSSGGGGGSPAKSPERKSGE